MSAIQQWGDFGEAKTTFIVGDGLGAGAALTADPTDNQRVIALNGQSRLALQFEYVNNDSGDLLILVEFATVQDPDTFLPATAVDLATGAVTLAPDLFLAAATDGFFNPVIDILQGYRKVRIGLSAALPGGNPSDVIVNFTLDGVRQAA